jgi:hypothetical protein
MKRIISTIVLLTIASASALGAGSSSSSPVSIAFIAYANGKSLYATVLAASLAGKMVDIVVGGCSQGYYPLVYQIVIYP